MSFNELRPSQCELSSREQECVRWVALAASNAEIARQMALQKPSVENMLTRIYRKLSLDDDPRRSPRVRLARWAWLHPEQLAQVPASNCRISGGQNLECSSTPPVWLRHSLVPDL
ncbi:MAG TPA: helix-turn-helix transcriptional regulator [Dehalococcoidia bacterium]|nr:helix-turn-helix transcriptional regulator [Dehalococcoidia bacterium]